MQPGTGLEVAADVGRPVVNAAEIVEGENCPGYCEPGPLLVVGVSVLNGDEGEVGCVFSY
jgi:hypothetical protein